MSDELPPLPPPAWGDGYEWMRDLGQGWLPVPGWGRDGWDLGDWPYAIVVHYDGDGKHGLATYVEGDIAVRSFATREERDAATDHVAAYHWRQNESGPDDLPDTDDELAPHHRGPYSWSRRDGGSRR
jgi:hypothetical protein